MHQSPTRVEGNLRNLVFSHFLLLLLLLFPFTDRGYLSSCALLPCLTTRFAPETKGNSRTVFFGFSFLFAAFDRDAAGGREAAAGAKRMDQREGRKGKKKTGTGVAVKGKVSEEKRPGILCVLAPCVPCERDPSPLLV